MTATGRSAVEGLFYPLAPVLVDVFSNMVLQHPLAPVGPELPAHCRGELLAVDIAMLESVLQAAVVDNRSCLVYLDRPTPGQVCTRSCWIKARTRGRSVSTKPGWEIFGGNGVYFGSEAHISQPTAHDKDLIAGRIILQDCFNDLV